jgi:hypothetical protein
LDGSKLVAGLDQFGPETLQHAAFDPALQSAMNRSIVAELFGQMIPLTSAAHLEDDAVQRFALIDAWSTRARLGIELVKDREDEVVPEFVGTIPDRGQRFHRSFVSCHPWLLGSKCRRIVPARITVLR